MAGRLRRGDAAVDIEKIDKAPVASQKTSQHAAAVRLFFVHRFDDEGAGAVAEKDAGRAIAPVENARKCFRADHQCAFVLPARDEFLRGCDRVNETGADRLDVEGRSRGRADFRLHDRRRRREGEIGRRRRDDDQVEIVRRSAGRRQRRFRRLRRKVGRTLIIRGDVALADAGALANPFVACVDDRRKIVIGHHVRRQIRSAASHHRLDCHSAASSALPARSWTIAIVWATSLRNPLPTRPAAMEIAAATPFSSAPPWLFTTMPLTPRKTPPLTDEGSIFALRFFSPPVIISAPILERSERVSSSLIQPPTRRAAPSADLSAMFPVKPSVTTTSTAPSEMSLPSTNPLNAMSGSASRRTRAALRISSWPFNSSAPTFKRPTVGFFVPVRARKNASPMIAKSTSSCSLASTLAPTSRTTVRPRGVGHSAVTAGRSTPGNMPSCMRETAISAPVFPPETTA